MLEQLTSSQVSEWMVYNRLDPIGEWRADYRIAILCSTIANIGNSVIYVMKRLWTRGNSRPPKMFTVLDFMPDWTEERDQSIKSEQTVEEQKSILLSIARALGAKHKKRKE